MQFRNVIISVSDKTGIEEIAGYLIRKFNSQLYTTKGTFKYLKENGISAKKIEELTGFPEILGGRVKTLHPSIFAGILSKRNNDTHKKELKKLKIPEFDLIIVNLYPFERVIKAENSSFDDAIENIDIGGISLIRAGAKNFSSVVVLTEPEMYKRFIELIENKKLTQVERMKFAEKAFRYTFYYDYIIYNYLKREKRNIFPEFLLLKRDFAFNLRYGENPHQESSLYYLTGRRNQEIEKLQGKELSFNNIVDMNSAIDIAEDLNAYFKRVAVIIMKHTNPCGAAIGKEPLGVFRKALSTDRLSAFGSIIVINGVIDGKLAEEMTKIFIEVIIAKGFKEDALKIFSRKKSLRLIKYPVKRKISKEYRIVSTRFGIIIQDSDAKFVGALKFVSGRKPGKKIIDELMFAFIVCKNVKSNAIVFTKGLQTVGVGAGQMSRIDSVKIAVRKAKEAKLSLDNSIIASDAFFPFRDSIDFVAKKGVKYIIQPGGSIRDDEVIAAAKECGICMVFTGMRHFKH